MCGVTKKLKMDSSTCLFVCFNKGLSKGFIFKLYANIKEEFDIAFYLFPILICYRVASVSTSLEESAFSRNEIHLMSEPLWIFLNYIQE